MRRMLAAGNWKMNGTLASAAEIEALIPVADNAQCDTLICPPATLVAHLAQAAKGSKLAIGGQDCHMAQSGAHTGDTAAAGLADAGAGYVIVGHSERRSDHGETDAVVQAKAQAAWDADLIAIICVGETEAERDAGNALAVVTGQITGSLPKGASAQNTVIAYEPVWAIGTGKVPSIDDIAEMHGAMRAHLTELTGAETAEGIRLLYGGSVKGSNAGEIFSVPDVDGGLVGGASLKATDFAPIIEAASAS